MVSPQGFVQPGSVPSQTIHSKLDLCLIHFMPRSDQGNVDLQVSSQPDDAGILVSLESKDCQTLAAAAKEMEEHLSAHAVPTQKADSLMNMLNISCN